MAKYLIRIPTPDGDFGFSLVDPSRLHLGVLTDIHEEVRQRGNERGRVPAHGARSVVHMTLDLKEHLTIVDALMEQARETLTMLGPQGKRLYEKVFGELRMKELLQATANADVHALRSAIEQTLYGLMAVSELASELEKKNALTEELSSTVVEMSRVVSRDDSSYKREKYTNWGLACVMLIDAVSELSAIEQSLNDRIKRAQHAQSEWQAKLADHSPLFRDAQAFLYSGDDPFIDRAVVFQASPEACRDMHERLPMAQQHVAGCKQLISVAEAAWNEFGVTIITEVETFSRDISRLCGEMHEHARKLMECEQDLGAGVPRPFQDSDGGINEVQYRTATSLLRNPQWSTRTCQQRLDRLARDLLEIHQSKPKHSEQLAKTLALADRYIAQVSKELDKFSGGPRSTLLIAETASSPQSNPPDADDPEGPISQAPDDGDEVADDAPPNSDRLDSCRLDELKEMVLCVYYVLTVQNKHFLSGTNMKNALRVLVELGRCTEEEHRHYLPYLHALYKADRELVSTGEANARQQASRSRWIYFKARTTWISKLTYAHADEAISFMGKHALDATTIRAGFATFREKKNARYLETKSVAKAKAKAKRA